jgi:hypothetical protein
LSCASAAHLDKTEVTGVARQARAALKSAPSGGLSGNRSQQACVACDLNFRAIVHAHFNSAFSDPATAANYRRSARFGVGANRRYKYRQNRDA